MSERKSLLEKLADPAAAPVSDTEWAQIKDLAYDSPTLVRKTMRSYPPLTAPNVPHCPSCGRPW